MENWYFLFILSEGGKGLCPTALGVGWSEVGGREWLSSLRHFQELLPKLVRSHDSKGRVDLENSGKLLLVKSKATWLPVVNKSGDRAHLLSCPLRWRTPKESSWQPCGGYVHCWHHPSAGGGPAGRSWGGHGEGKGTWLRCVYRNSG